MSIRQVVSNEREQFDIIAPHPLQSWAWGEFREKLGQNVIRLGRFSNGKLVEISQISIHKIPHTSWKIGYCPRGSMLTKEMVEAIKRETKKYNCIFVKFEPNVLKTAGNAIQNLGLRPGKSLFTLYSFQVDLTKSETQLLSSMKPKTRYNIRVAEKKGVEVSEDNSDKAFEAFQQLTEETTTRQHFYAHGRTYRKLMWETMRKAGVAHLLIARYKKEVLTTWILFFFNGIGYYPYGASSEQYRDVMASNLVAWRALQLAKGTECKTFDFWGSLGQNPDKNDPWYGFHRFKEGYGGTLVEFVGTWDLVLKPIHYSLYTIADKIRWMCLRK